MTTIAQVKESFETELHAIFALDQALAAERSALKRKAFVEGKQLTPEEVKRRKEIAATRGELAEAMEALALDTVDALENASDVDDLLASISAVNQQLEDDLERLKAIEETTKKVEKVVSGMATVIDKLQGLKSVLI
ncbi:MAG: hypothetical protein GKR94_07730 [Gammaproteobacteria bacterium]|nr:hypothetical protein [Gammaproteobacteria bacterium]